MNEVKRIIGKKKISKQFFFPWVSLMKIECIPIISHSPRRSQGCYWISQQGEKFILQPEQELVINSADLAGRLPCFSFDELKVRVQKLCLMHRAPE